MDNQVLPLVTAEEAVARILLIDHIPDECTLLELTSAFFEEAIAEVVVGRSEQFPADELALLEVRASVCEARHKTAEKMLLGLKLESGDRANYLVRVEDDKGGNSRWTLSSVIDWAFFKFGIGSPTILGVENSGPPTPSVTWEAVTIKIYANHMLGIKVGDGAFRRCSFFEAGLMDLRTNSPNSNGVTLIGLSEGLKYPKGRKALPVNRTAMAYLRAQIRSIVELPGNPFRPFNEADGWKPRFDLRDDRHTANSRAEKDTPHVSFDDLKRHTEGHGVWGNSEQDSD